MAISWLHIKWVLSDLLSWFHFTKTTPHTHPPIPGQESVTVQDNTRSSVEMLMIGVEKIMIVIVCGVLAYLIQYRNRLVGGIGIN